MNEDTHLLLDRLRPVSCPDDLHDKVVARVRLSARRADRRRMLTFGISAAASLGGTAALAVSLAGTLQQSGFYHYLTLLGSGDGVVYGYWKELALSLAESMPTTGLIVFFAVAACFIWSAAKMVAGTRQSLFRNTFAVTA